MRAGDRSWGWFVCRFVAILFAGSCLVGTVQAAITNADFTDIWWNPAESGWGINFVQTGNFIFATAFIYGETGAPFWVSGELTLQAPVGTPAYFQGPLYVTSNGPYYGGPYTGDPRTLELGSMSLHSIVDDRAGWCGQRTTSLQFFEWFIHR